MINDLIKPINLSNFTEEEHIELVGILSKINKSHLDDELVNHSAVYGYYHSLMISAKKKLDTAKTVFELYASQFKTDKRKEKKYAVAELDDLTASQMDYQLYFTDLVNAEEVYSRVKAICQMLEHKKDMLVQLSANQRAEAKIYS